MPSRRSCRHWFGLALVLGASGGCATLTGAELAPGTSTGHSVSEHARLSAGPVLGPRSCVHWSIADPARPEPMTGTAVVGPDGTVELGPYGSFPVTGLTIEEAHAETQQRLTARVAAARVCLAEPDAASGGWRPGGEARAARQVHQIQQIQHRTTVPASHPTQFATGVRSTWKPAQREEAQPARTAAAPAVPPEAPRALPPEVTQIGGVWQPARGGLLQRINGTGPELAPPPAPLVPEPVMPGPEMSGPFVGEPVEGGQFAVAAPLSVVRPPHAGLLQKHKRAPLPVPNVPNERVRMAFPAYRLGISDILLIDSLEGVPTQQIRGPHLVRPDGTLGVGFYGSVYVAGLTIEEARVEIARLIQSRLDPTRRSLKDVLDGLSVDVAAYNSRWYYVITDRLGSGEVVERLPITGNETVLDAISQIKGLPPESSKRHIWVARPTAGGDAKMPVDWIAITQRADTRTNYQIYPGDRVYVRSEAIQKTDNIIAKILSPIQRLFGAALLGAETVNTIRSGQNFR